MKTTQTTTITKTMPKQTPKPQRQRRSKKSSQVLTKIVNTTANVAKGSTIRNGAGAKMMSNGNITRVSHREFISDVSAPSSGFSTVNFAINPGNATAFPWLSAIAANYESYTFKKLNYRYVPLCPTSTQGRVTMAIDYDARDAIPTNKAVLSQYQGAVATPVWQQALYVATPQNLTKFAKQRYVSGATIPASSDIKTYHLGQLILATSNTPTTATSLGELWVEYDVEFQTPQIATATVGASNADRQPISGGAQRVKIGIRNALPIFDTSFTDELHNILGQTWDYAISGVSKRKFSIIFNKFLNHPVLYLIRHSGKMRFVRTQATTLPFQPSFRQKGTGDATLGFSSIDLSSTLGLGLSDPTNAALDKLFIAFIAFPSALTSANDPNQVASQMQFAYDLTGPNAISNLDAAIDIQSIALPPMQNNDLSASLFANVPSEDTNNFTSHSYVNTVGWLTLASQLSSLSSITLRQVLGDNGEPKFKPLRQVMNEEALAEGRVDTDASVYAVIEDVIKLIRDKATIRDEVVNE